MTRTTRYNIAVMPGDGIGTEIMEACLRVLDVLNERIGGPGFDWNHHDGGAEHYAKTGTALSDETMAALKAADAILFGAMGMPHIRYPNGTEIAPQLDIRSELELYAGVRPIRTYPGLPSVLSDSRADQIDLVLIREQTEGLFYSRGAGKVEDDKRAFDTMMISRDGTDRVSEFSFRLAERRALSRGRAGKVTCVDKANVFTSMAFFRKVFSEVATRHHTVTPEYAYVDATALNLVKSPWNFDVLVTENMFGDILSDLTAALVGSLGLAPSADIGDKYAMFQPAHGSAPDIAGQGKANPLAQILSAAMMYDWLSDRDGMPVLAEGARIIEHAVEEALTTVRPMEFGGKDGTEAIADAVIAQIRKV